MLGRQRSAISWHGKDGKTFATEEREVTAYAAPGGTLIDWTTVLSTKLDKVRLDGDPQHAGFHFRAAHGGVQERQGEHLLPAARRQGQDRRDAELGRRRGKDREDGQPAVERDAASWSAASGTRCCGSTTRTTRSETRGSERDYGRFGDYFEYDLTPDKPLKLKYRVWVQEGEMTVEQCDGDRRRVRLPARDEGD